MKQIHFPSKTGPLQPRKKFASILNNKWLLAILLFLAAAACKKVTEVSGIVNLCPVVVSTDPMDKAVDVALNKVISVTFNTDMNPTTINGNSFTIKQGTQIVPGKVAPTNNGAVFTFTPDIPLLPFKTYTGTITMTATDKFRTAMEKDYVWTFTTIPQIYLSTNGTAGGTVTGAGAFAQGATVTVAATPRTGYTFTNWTDSGTTTVASASPSYQFTMNGNRSLVANFTVIPPAKFSVVTSSSPIAGGSTFGSGSYDVGSTVTVIESPNPGYTFLNWTENGNIISTSSSFQFTITGNRTFVANFTLIPALQFAVILSNNPPAGGTNSGSGTYASGTSVTVNATPNTGYTFVNWTDNGTIVSTSSSYTFVITATRTLVANYVINSYTLVTTASPALGGTITRTPDQTRYDHGSQVLLTAIPATGYSFVNWTEGGTVRSTSAAFQIAMTGNRTLVANFSAKTYTLNVLINPTGGGTVAKNPNRASYDSGTTVILTATPATGYTFTSWNGDATGSVNPLTVNMNANKNITANFTVLIPAGDPIILGTAANFGAFGGNAGVTNQGVNTIINNGGIGTTAASTLITGFHDGMTGDVYTETGDNIGNATGGIFTAPPPPGTAAKFTIAQKALADANLAYLSISPASKPGGSDPGAGELGGLTLAPGVYKSASGEFKISTADLTLDAKGDPNAIWIFQAPTSLTVGIAGPLGARSVKLINGALAKNVFWYVGSAATINGAGGGVMSGTIISTAGVTFSTAGNAAQTVLNGRAFSLVASVTMVNTTINNQ